MWEQPLAVPAPHHFDLNQMLVNFPLWLWLAFCAWLASVSSGDRPPTADFVRFCSPLLSLSGRKTDGTSSVLCTSPTRLLCSLRHLRPSQPRCCGRPGYFSTAQDRAHGFRIQGKTGPVHGRRPNGKTFSYSKVPGAKAKLRGHLPWAVPLLSNTAQDKVGMTHFMSCSSQFHCWYDSNWSFACHILCFW